MRYISSVILLIFLASSCSNNPQSNAKNNTTSNSNETIKKTAAIDVKEENHREQTAEEIFTLAQSLNNQAKTVSNQEKVSALLIQASALFLQQKNYAKALWLSNKASNLVKDNSQSVYQLLLVKAASLQALNYHEQAFQQLSLANQLALLSAEPPNNKLTLTLPYYQILSAALFEQGLGAAATSANLTAFSLNPQATEQDIKLIWQQLNSLSQWQLSKLSKEQPPYFNGWQQLLGFSHQYGANQQDFSFYLDFWQQTFPTHPAQILIPSLKEILFNKPIIKNIAVILPLTGKQKKVGLVAQQGVLAAYQSAHDKKLHFIDSNQLDWTLLAEQLSNMKIDHVIGPLLKSNVKSYLTQSEQHLALQVPTLLLNSPQNKHLKTYQVALSLQPEDEAIQAAMTLSQQNYLNPIILSYQDRASKRIALTFQNHWKTLTGHKIELFFIKKGKKMQASLKTSLGIDASQSRIKTLISKLQKTIKTDTRNRRDVDMIYVVANAAQTRLIKPYIDVHTSPFAKIIPVFASSRSHSDFDSVNNGSINDLQGLTFTEMPWLLSSKQQNKTLSALSKKLWPKRRDNLSKIFALGFDSFNLLDKIPLMQQAPYIRYFGQTGTLQLTQNNILSRSLIWGKYQRNKVKQVVME